jgi:cytochrome c oxidase subunit 2
MSNRMNSVLKGRSAKRRTGLATVAALSLLLVSCGGRPLSTFDARSPIAQKLDTALVVLLIACGVVLVIIAGGVLYMAKRFGVPAPEDDSQVYGDEEFPEQTHGNTRLEIGWTIVPTVIMAIVAFFTLGLLFELHDVSATDDRQIQSVTVVGQQWWWEFQYHLDDDGIPDIVTANELVLPVNQEIHLDVTSRDVIHSFWVPRLNGKRDAVPGRTSPWTIEAGEIGRFAGECTEFCGLSHAYMEKYAVGISLEDWKVWAANQMLPAELPEEGTEAFAGWEVFNNQCTSCHVVNGLTSLGSDEGVLDSFAIYDGSNRIIDKQTQVSGAAPNLTHLATRSTFAGSIFELYENPESHNYIDLATDGELNRGALEAWIVNAPEQKANFWDSPTGQRGMTPFTALSAEEIDNLVAFLMTLD